MKGNVFAVYDISSSSVAGAHVLRTDTTPVVLASARSDAPLQEEMDMERFVEEGVKHLGDVVVRIKNADVHHPSHIQVVLASPWYSSQTRTVVYKKETPFIATNKLVDSLVEAEIAEILKKEAGAFVAFGDQSVVVERQISAIKLNGYQTGTPFGKHAVTLELFLTVTIAPKPILDRFTDVLRRAYGTRDIAFTTSPFTTFVVMRDIHPSSEEAVIIDVGEEITDVAFIKGGIMLYQHSFPVGTFGLYRALAGRSANTTRESMALLEAYRLGKLSSSAGKTVETAISAFITHWQSWFHQILEGGHYGFCLPSQCIVTADPRFQVLFTEALATDEFLKHSCAIDKSKVTYINEETLSGHVRTSDQTALDIPIATGALYVDRVIQV
jgi:hypothetical protein